MGVFVLIHLKNFMYDDTLLSYECDTIVGRGEFDDKTKNYESNQSTDRTSN